jgi:hypothetical protein
VTHEELGTKAFDAAKKAFDEVAKCVNPETGEPAFEDAVDTARSAVIDTVLHHAASIVEWAKVPEYGLSPVGCRAQIANMIRADIKTPILRKGDEE